jgi:uncharacterized protein (TIGR02001 family)
VVVGLCSAGPVAFAQENAEPTEADDSIGLDFEVAVASAYVFRGLNVFQKDRQSDRHAFVAPAITFAVPDTGLSLGYWGAYQIVGDNRAQNTDAALNLEQDLFATYDLSLHDSLTVSSGVFYYFYPFADIPGTSNPSILEPVVKGSYTSAVDLGLSVSYFYALQEEIKALRHIYVSPSVSKGVDLSESVGLAVGASFGYKRFDDEAIKDNVYDVSLNVGVPLDVGGGASVTPSINAAWTNLQDADFGDEYVIWGRLAFGFGL